MFTAPSGAPANFTASLNGTVLSLSWAPPSEDERNGVIISYTLTCDIDGEIAFSLNLSTIEQIDVGVYESDSTYTCEIFASTSVGGGPEATVTITTGGQYCLYSDSKCSVH